MDSKENDLISVIIPAYNVEKYIRKCLYSVLGQTYKNIEILVIDDGSMDNTGIICDRIAVDDLRVRVFHIPNGGVSVARNLGLLYATGKYIAFIDADDFVDNRYLSILYKGIQDVELSIVDYYIAYNHNTTYNCKSDGRILELEQEEVLNNIYSLEMYQGYLWNKLFLRDIIAENHILFMEKVKIWEDMLFCVEYMTHINKARYIRTPMYYYVQTDISVMNAGVIWYEFTQLKIIDRILACAENIGGTFLHKTKHKFGSTLINSIYYRKDYSSINMEEVKVVVSKVSGMKNEIGMKNIIKFYGLKYFPYFSIKLFTRMKGLNDGS